MMIFFNRFCNYGNDVDQRIAIPMEKLAYIIQHGKEIQIAYNSGEYVFLNDECKVAVPKIETFIVRYDHRQIAEDVLRSFYVACEQGKGAFYFG